MSIESNSNLGGVSSILILMISALSFISLVTTFAPSTMAGFSMVSFLVLPLGLVSLILFFVGMNGLSHDFQESAIFNNALYSVLSVIVGIVALFAVAFAVIFFNIGSLISTANPSQLNSNSYHELLRSMALDLIPILVAGIAVGLISMLFLRRSFNSLAEKSGVFKFKKAGTLFPISAVVGAVFLILAIGLFVEGAIGYSSISIIGLPSGLVQLAAWILAAQGFFGLKRKARENQFAAPVSPRVEVPMIGHARYCPNCGAQNNSEAVFCGRCGKNL